MKTRFTTVDLVAVLHDVRKLIGLRVANVYDIDNKTYLIKLAKPDEKGVILIESGARVHVTDFDYGKNLFPSGFAMKLRKHVKQKRLESVQQLGVDRIVDFQFGSGEVACHFIVELYDRGNLILTDQDYTILNVLRPRTDKENTDVRFAVREKYPVHLARKAEQLPSQIDVRKLLESAKNPRDNLRKFLTAKFPYGTALLEHAMLQVGISSNMQIGKFLAVPEDFDKLYRSLVLTNEIFARMTTDPEFPRGIITLKLDTQANGEIFESYTEFHPFLYQQHDKENGYKKFDRFNQAVDEFFSRIESQKIESKTMQQEKTALKKLENIRQDHQTRLRNLQSNQSTDRRKAELIELNKQLVDRAILIVNSALANQMTWAEIQESIDEAKEMGDKTARAIKSLKLDVNHISLRLKDPFLTESEAESDEENDQDTSSAVTVDIDLGFGTFQNARKYYTQKKQSALKESKTIAASEKALKSAEAKTQDLLKQVQLIRNIQKTRKTFWFEKFFWFISSDGYLVIGGRDAQQNEMIVKRYLKVGDAYVHADIKGASSVVIKNRLRDSTANDIPPKTFSEAGTMAICYSAAWDAKVVTSAWWVHAEQVSKTAPTGLYLGTGSFMIRGKKNYLPPCQLIMGFGILFKLDEESVLERVKMRKEKEQQLVNGEEPNEKVDTTNIEENQETVAEVELAIDDGDSEDEEVEISDNSLFPDVAINMRHLSVDDESSSKPDEEFSILQIGPTFDPHARRAAGPAGDKKAGKKQSGKKGAGQKPTEPVKTGSAEFSADKQKQGQQPKRGQRAKLKKIKEKYKDQDKEERDLRLRLLGSAGLTPKNDPNTRDADDKQLQVNVSADVNENPSADLRRVPPNDQKQCDVSNLKEDAQDNNKDSDDYDEVIEPNDELVQVDEENEAEDDEPEEADADDLVKFADESTSVIDSLTGLSYESDQFLFAVCTCAPYTAMNDYKYKVKLTPGQGKKGKATKTAVQVFLKDRMLTQREKELIKALNDQDLSKNLPGKVKLSAPQLQIAKKKR